MSTVRAGLSDYRAALARIAEARPHPWCAAHNYPRSGLRFRAMAPRFQDFHVLLAPLMSANSVQL